MFDIAWSEILLIAVLALIFIGPKELPHVLYNIARGISKLRQSADDFKRQFEESMRDAGYEDLHKNLQDFRSLNPASRLKESIDRALNQDYGAPPRVEPEAGAAVSPDAVQPAAIGSALPVTVAAVPPVPTTNETVSGEFARDVSPAQTNGHALEVAPPPGSTFGSEVPDRLPVRPLN